MSTPVSEERDIIDLSAPEKTPEGTVVLAPEELAEMTQIIVKALKTVYDPEIPVDIYELGLIYKVDFERDSEGKGHVAVDMTLTAPGCPVAGEMPIWVQEAVLEVEGVQSAKVSMVFEPPWTPARMSDEAKLELGWM